MRYLTTPQLQQFGQLPIIGGRDCESVTKTPQHGESFKIGDRISVKALHTPCHTQDSVCYFMEDGDQRVVFTGDTLFIGGMFYVVGFNVLDLLLMHVRRLRPVLRGECAGDAQSAE